MTPKHDVSVQGSRDDVEVIIFTFGDNPSFNMSFDSYDEVDEWVVHIQNAVKLGRQDQESSERLERSMKEIVEGPRDPDTLKNPL